MTDEPQAPSTAERIEAMSRPEGGSIALLSGGGLKWSLAGFGCVAMVLIVLAFLIDALQSREADYAAARRIANNMARTLAEHGERVFEAAGLILDGINEDLKGATTLSETERAAVAIALQRRLAYSPQVQAAVIFDREGAPIIDSRIGDRPVGGDRAFYQRLVAGAADATGVHIGATLFEPMRRSWVIPVSHPLGDAGEQASGTIVALVDSDYFRDFFGAIGLPHQARLTLATLDGTLIVTEPDFDRFVGRSMATASLFTQHLPASEYGNFDATSALDGLPRIIAYRRLANTALVMVVSLSKAAITAEWRATSQARGIAAVSICTVLGLLTLLLIMQVTRREHADIAVHRLHTALRKTSDQLEVALANMGQGLCLFDAEHRLAVFNNRYLELFKLPAEQVPQGTTLREIMELSAKVGNYSEPEIERVIADRLAIARDGKPRTFVQRLNDGRIIEGVHRPLPGGAFVATYTDVTERENRALALIDAKEQAEQASRIKTEFLAHMSHELRTPLNAILGFSELLEQGYMGALSQRQREYVEHIHVSGQHLLDLINQILDLSRVEAGRLELAEEPVLIADLVNDCVELMRIRLAGAGLALEIEVADDLPLLRGDLLRLRQILLNLLSNAAKFTPPGGSIVIQAAMTEGGELLLAIKDTGIGMSPEDIEVALQPFRQIDNPMSRRFEGSGLGLPLSKKLIELHGGRVEIVSRLNVGTEVRAIFPADRLQARLQTPQAEIAAAEISAPPD